MKVLKNNRGLLIFYLCMVVFTVFWALKVDENNDKMMLEKNAYILSDNL